MKKLALVAAVGALAFPVISHAGIVYNFDVNTTSSATYSGVGVADDAGTVWNGLTVDTSVSSANNIYNSIVDSTGASSGLSVTMLRNSGDSNKVGNYISGGNPAPSDLMSDYVYWDTWNVTITGLEAGTYNLYGMGHQNTEAGTTTFTWGTASDSTTSDLADYRNIFADNAEGNTYVKLTGTVGEDGVLAFSSASGLAGFQIEAIPEPATFGLMGIFGGGLYLFRRRLKR